MPVVGTQAVALSVSAIAGATLILAIAFLVPFLGLALACRPTANTGARRLAYASVTAPTLYVFLGVVQALVHSPIPDEIVWCVIWLAIAIWSQRARNPVAVLTPAVGRWRVVHGRCGDDPLPLRAVPYSPITCTPPESPSTCNVHEDRTRGSPRHPASVNRCWWRPCSSRSAPASISRRAGAPPHRASTGPIRSPRAPISRCSSSGT